MTRPRYVRQAPKCVCMNAADAPSTHRGADHLGDCPHSTLQETTGGYVRLALGAQARRAAAVARRQAAERRRARPVAAVVITLGDDA